MSNSEYRSGALRIQSDHRTNKSHGYTIESYTRKHPHFQQEKAMLSVRRLREVLGAATRLLEHRAAPAGHFLSSAADGGGDTLGRRLLSLIYPKRSAVVVLRRWAEEGKSIQKYQLNRIVRELRKHGRYKHALEICEWMAIEDGFKLLPGDYAVHLDLIAKVRGLASAEKFFEDLPGRIKEQQSTCSALLHTFVQSGEAKKAESLFKEMSDHGLITCAVPYNHILHLYVSSGQPQKVPEIVSELKKYVSPDLLTYNFWLAACGNDFKTAGKVFDEMQDRGVLPDWVTFSTIAKAYTSGGLLQKANWALGEMEKNISKKDRPGYSSLITQYASLSDKTSLLRTWEKMKFTFRKISDREYGCMISSLLKLSEDDEAQEIYDEWESVSGTRDPKIPNKILESLIKNGGMKKGSIFLQGMLKKGIKPSYNTWRIMARGHLGEEKMDRAIECVKKALTLVKKWDPDEEMAKAVFERIEFLGDVDGAEEFLGMLRNAGYVKTWVYNSVLRTYAKAEKMPLVVLERMEKDGVQPDEETRDLLKSTSRFCVVKIAALVS